MNAEFLPVILLEEMIVYLKVQNFTKEWAASTAKTVKEIELPKKDKSPANVQLTK